VTEGLPFLGFTIFPHCRRLKGRKGIYLQHKLRAMMATQRAGEVPLAHITAGVQGWVNHVGYGHTLGLRRAVMG
jgi:RNA-directed DNA polymerase